YLKGNDASRWITDLPTYRRVRVAQVYDGIDLVFHGAGRELEYDFVVRPGADPRRIALRFENAERAQIDAKGDLLLDFAGQQFRQHKPIVYQQLDGRRQTIEGRYVLKGSIVRFELGSYDRSRELVIDPTLSYSTYLGGSGDERGTGIAVDGSGRAY